MNIKMQKKTQRLKRKYSRRLSYSVSTKKRLMIMFLIVFASSFAHDEHVKRHTHTKHGRKSMSNKMMSGSSCCVGLFKETDSQNKSKSFPEVKLVSIEYW